MIGLIVALTLVAYAGSFSGELVFDDFSAVADNPSIRKLWPLSSVLNPPVAGGDTVGGRPLLNLSLAVNYAMSGTRVRSYHALNLLVHLAAALTLFGVVRRTLLGPMLRDRFGAASVLLAGAVAVGWAVHPLQTESVAYIVQRAESLMGLCYLLTLYGFIRASASPQPMRWWVLTVLSCLAGMATKEVMITAPVIVLLFDRTFVGGSFRAAGRERKWAHLALAATWILLGWLMAQAGGNRGGTKGLGLGFAWWEFPLTQFQAVAHYLRLAIWPSPLAFEYERFWVTGFAQVVPYAVAVVPLAVASLVALWRWPVFGFLGCWFFGILAPSSLAPGASQMIAEHRMYLPLAAVIIAIVFGLWRVSGARGLVAIGILSLGCAALTAHRLLDYRTALTLWSDTVAKRPANGVAHGQLASALVAADRHEEALVHFAEAIRLEALSEPVGQRALLAELRVNQGNALLAVDREDDAMRAYLAALEDDPEQKLAYYNLGTLFMRQGNYRLAEERFSAALRIDPAYASAHTNLASALIAQGRLEDALGHYETVLRLQPDSARAEANVGYALLRMKRLVEAAAQLERAVKQDPALAPAHEFLGDTYAAQGRVEDARREFEEAQRLGSDPTGIATKLRRLAR